MSRLSPRSATLSTTATAVENRLATSKPHADEPHETEPYLLSRTEVLARFEVDPSVGLTAQQASERRARYGPNGLESGNGVSWVRVLAGQIGASDLCTCANARDDWSFAIVNAMVMVMILALIVSLAIRSWIESGVIAGAYHSLAFEASQSLP